MNFKIFILKILFFLLFFFILSQPSSAQDNPVYIYLFWGQGCPHCAREKVFLDKLIKKYPNVEVKAYEVSQNRENLKLLQKVGNELGADIKGGIVPFTAVGKYHFVGFLDEETTGKQIEDALICHINEGCQDIVAPIIEGNKPTKEIKTPVNIPKSLSLPLIGEISTKNLSLPVLTILIAFIDGFNPCAMWVLLFLISLLIGLKDKKRMWILGTTFIVSSALVYFMFMTAWLNLFLFLGFVFWIRMVIGLVAVGAGGFNLYSYFQNKKGGCEIIEDKKRQKKFSQIRIIITNKKIILALTGIVLLAFSVNLVELVCSAGLPAIYTQILSFNNLATWQYYSYLLLYIFIFMLDDLVIFIIAMITLEAVGIESKYSRLSKLLGGIIIVILGLLLLFKPEWLMFG